MNSTRFDRISKLFAQRRFRRAVTQEATPAPANEPGGTPDLLFVQTFQAGAIAPKEGTAGRFTLTLEAGTGQTVYFSDRPDRVVGTNPTPQFLERLGFADDNPPNAALVVETSPGETDVAVMELFSPLYDPTTRGVTYEVEVLENWETELDAGLQEEPTDLATLEPTFGTAHLFIDGIADCPDMTMECVDMADPTGPTLATIDNSVHDGFCKSWSYGACLPCQPWFSGYVGRRDAYTYWTNQCRALPGCKGRNCVPRSVCSDLIGCR